jgi:CxxC motif-containing protein (DUF1111 family)
MPVARARALTLSCVLVSCAASDDPLSGLTVVGLDPTDAPIAGLDPDTQRHFDLGDAAFEAVMRPAQGLGPVFIRAACASCHEGDAKGPGFVDKLAVVDADGSIEPAPDQSALPWGSTVRPYVAGGATTPIQPPEGATLCTSRRIGPAVFGRGYVEAVSDAEIERVAAEQAAGDGPVRGRVPYLDIDGQRAIGRLGVKSRLASVEDFVTDAYLGDMSITTPQRPDELPNPDGLADDERAGVDLDLDTVLDVTAYVRLLEIPARPEPAAEDLELFAEVGCATCHVPTMHTRADYPIALLADIDAPIYSDLLLHDLGPDLADCQVGGEAGPRDFRTAPLIGLRHLRNYLHDGRASTLEEAILLHDGEGSEATPTVDRFLALDDETQARLLAFVASL